MHGNAYHYLQTFTIVPDDLTDGQFAPAVLDQLRGSARRRFLEQLGAHTESLAKQGLQLRICDLTRSTSLNLRPGDVVAVTQLLERLEDDLLVLETVYCVSDGWTPVYQERIRVRIEDRRGQCRIPEPLQSSARKWLGLIRGLTPGASAASQSTGQS